MRCGDAQAGGEGACRCSAYRFGSVAVIGGDDVCGVLVDVAVVTVVERDPPAVGVGGLADRPEPGLPRPFRPLVLADRAGEDRDVLRLVPDLQASRVGYSSGR